MKITIDTEKNTMKVGTKTFGIDLAKEKGDAAFESMRKFIRNNTRMSSYEEDSMWMSYRYCVGCHTIASNMRAGEIADECYDRMSEERSVFTAYDINREIERCMSYRCGPDWHFPITSLNRIYTSAVDIFCQFVEDYEITSIKELLDYKDVHVILHDNERGYKLETVTWEEYLRPKVHEIVWRVIDNQTTDEDWSWEYYVKWWDGGDINEDVAKEFEELSKHRIRPDNFFMSDIKVLFVWNDLVHLFDVAHHHKSVLVDGTECEWYWTYTTDSEQREDGYFYEKEIGFKKIRVPVTARIGSVTTWLPEKSIAKTLF